MFGRVDEWWVGEGEVVINMHKTRYFYASKSHTKDKSLKNNIMYNILVQYTIQYGC